MNETLSRAYIPPSKTVEWETPQSLFNELHEIFDFTMDVCATNENAKCKTFYTKDDDGLTKHWIGRIWCNPPYGDGIEKWLKKAYETTNAILGGVRLLYA